jgi:sugar/nucleoside kinase (ribokinase family)
MGRRVGVVTSAGPDLDVAQALPGIEVLCKPAVATTLFENIYLRDGRKQVIHQRADVIACDQIPAAWCQAPLVYLGSIDREIEPSVFSCFAGETLLGVMPQGFFRQWDERGLVRFVEWDPPEEVLRRINVLVISELDVPSPDRLVRAWKNQIDTIVVTHAERGATVHQADKSCHYPARPTHQIDPTGAGDVFLAAFMIRLDETGDPCLAAQFANVVASFSVEGPGVTGIPFRWQAEAYLDSASSVTP